MRPPDPGQYVSTPNPDYPRAVCLSRWFVPLGEDGTELLGGWYIGLRTGDGIILNERWDDLVARGYSVKEGEARRMLNGQLGVGTVHSLGRVRVCLIARYRTEMTPQEARELASLLIEHADEAERETP